ncbi:MarR family winged helix-turn-helix transcriptional regulator [Bosea sp. (in: a-proteobacteria)]|uniref:MarR family winged helix-turn-helix transcriptional regulator n=1 Tax=Bosea sp. (in: a-proteobacteria) TaxID=1871050 RepID=UPI002FC80893
MRLIADGDAGETEVSRRRAILDGTAIPTAYKIGYVLNFYREPSFRMIETEFGLTRPEIVILIFLTVRDGATASEFCEFSGHLKASVSRAVILLEKKKLIRRQPDPADNRRQLLYLTAEGRALYERYIPMLKAREAAMLACLDDAERGQLDRLLDKLAAHVPEWGPASDL